MHRLRPPLKSEDELTFQLLQNEDMVAALPVGHALAKRKAIDLLELKSEPFILYPRAVRPGLADAVVRACEKAGFTPKIEQYAPQLSATINLVAASLGVSIVPLSMRGLQPGRAGLRSIARQAASCAAWAGASYRGDFCRGPQLCRTGGRIKGLTSARDANLRRQSPRPKSSSRGRKSARA